MSRLDPRLKTPGLRSLRGRVCALMAVTATGLALACSPVLGTAGATASPGGQGHGATALASKHKKCKKGQVLRRNRCVRKVGSGY
jgi:hypothetical protein